MAKTKIQVKNDELNKNLVELSAQAFEHANQPNIAKTIRGAKTFSEVADMFSDEVGTGTNTLAGNLYGFLAHQKVVYDDLTNLYGDIFREGEPIEYGSGFSYVEVLNNSVGLSEPINYQTSTDAAGTIAFGKSFAGAPFINCTVQSLPFNQIAEGLRNWITLNITVPVQFASFSGLSPIKANEILESYNKRIDTSRRLYFYHLGNTLFTYFINNGYFANVIEANQIGAETYDNMIFSPETVKGVYTPPTTLMEALQQEIIPLLEYMKQPRYSLNLGINYGFCSWGLNTSTTETSWINWLDAHIIPDRASVAQLPWVNYNSEGYLGPNLKSANLEDLVMFVSVKTAASLKTLLGSNYLGQEKMDAEFNGNRITKLCGVDVVVVGSNVQLPEQVAQGQVQGTGKIGTPLISDDEIIIMEKDALLFHKYYDQMYKTDTLVASMVQLARQQIGYLPFLNAWKVGAVIKFDKGVLNATQYLNVKQIA